jgi:hypothetical protein
VTNIITEHWTLKIPEYYLTEYFLKLPLKFPEFLRRRDTSSSGECGPHE